MVRKTDARQMDDGRGATGSTPVFFGTVTHRLAHDANGKSLSQKPILKEAGEILVGN